ncbi:histone [Streptomyces sp. NPDC088732]|uniref:histone n=1 Tax=Streptomyces sp. NPDC088732 TaxID=3365879 RepID=UPI0038104767
MRDALRTCLQIAGGLTEATRRRAVGAARELLDQAGIDVEEVQRSIGRRIPAEVQTLADELMRAGRANRDLLVGLIREEIDKAMTRVSRLADDVTRVGVVLEALERRIRNLEGDARPEPAADASDAAGTGDMDGGEADPGLYVPPQPPVEHVPVEGEEQRGKTAAPTARKNAAPATAPATPKKAATPSRTPVAGPTARKNAAPGAVPAAPKPATPTVKKAAAKKAAPAAKSAPAKTAATGTAGKTAAARKAAPAAKKTAPAKKTTAKKSAAATKAVSATKSAAKTTAAKKAAPAVKAAPAAEAPAKKAATAAKSAAKKSAAKKTTGTREAGRD